VQGGQGVRDRRDRATRRLRSSGSSRSDRRSTGTLGGIFNDPRGDEAILVIVLTGLKDGISCDEAQIVALGRHLNSAAAAEGLTPSQASILGLVAHRTDDHLRNRGSRVDERHDGVSGRRGTGASRRRRASCWPD